MVLNFQLCDTVLQLTKKPDTKTVRVKISADGAKMSRLSNFVIVSHSLIGKSDKLDMSSKGEDIYQFFLRNWLTGQVA